MRSDIYGLVMNAITEHMGNLRAEVEAWRAAVDAWRAADDLHTSWDWWMKAHKIRVENEAREQGAKRDANS